MRGLGLEFLQNQFNALLDYAAGQSLTATVFIVLGVQCLLSLVLLGYVFYKRGRRMISRINNNKREDRIRKAIIDYYFSHFEKNEASAPPEKVALPKFGWESRGFFRRVLISTASRFHGRDRNILINLYREMGYLEKDLKDLKSFFWWKRLAAVIRLENLQVHEAVTLLIELIEDKNEMVALASMRAVSSLHFPGKASRILDALSRRAPTRRDIFVDILNNLGHEHIDEVVDYLLSCYDPYIASVCISVLGRLRVERSADVLMNFLRSSDDEVIAETVKALGLIRHEPAVSFIRELLKHPVATVRANAVEALVLLRDKHSLGLVLKLEQDKDVNVRRAVFHALQGGL